MRPPLTVHHCTTEAQLSFRTAFGLLKGRVAFVLIETRHGQFYPAPIEGNAQNAGEKYVSLTDAQVSHAHNRN